MRTLRTSYYYLTTNYFNPVALAQGVWYVQWSSCFPIPLNAIATHSQVYQRE